MKNYLFSSIVLICTTICALSQQTKIVTNNLNSGLGSLRNAIEEAESHDSILFDNSLDGDTIKLESEIRIDSISLVFNADSKNITISGQHLTKIFDVSVALADTISFFNISIINGFANGTNVKGIRGGGIVITADNGSYVNFKNCSFLSNTASYDGGAIWINSNDLLNNGGGSVYFNNCIFEKNYGGYTSGAIDNQTVVKLFIQNCSFINNSADRCGVGFIKNLTMENCFLKGNIAKDYCAAFILYDSKVINTGFFCNLAKQCLIQCENTDYSNNVFAGNISSEGWFIIEYDNINFYNCTFIDNYSEYCFLIFNSITFKVYNCLIYGSHFTFPISENNNRYINCASSEFSGNVGKLYKLEGNPFYDLNEGRGADSLWGTEDDNFALNNFAGGGLLCINKGNKDYISTDNTNDYVGNPRIFDDQVDIGAVEYMNHLSYIEESESEIKGEPLTIYPNPAERIFNIKVPDFNKIIEVKISIYNISGILVFNEYKVYEGNPIIIENKLLKGSYFVRVQGDGKIYNHKLIVL